MLPLRDCSSDAHLPPKILSSTALAAACLAFFLDWPEPIATRILT